MESGLIKTDQTEKSDVPILVESKFSKFIRAKGIYVAMVTTSLGLFTGLPLIFWLSSVTVISIGGLFIFLFTCGILGLIQWRFVRDLLDMEYHHFTMYAFTGFGMCLINFILLVNYNIRINTYSQTFEIARISVFDRNFDVTLEGDHHIALERGLGNYMERNYDLVPTGKKLTVTFETGLFGMDIIRDCKFN